MDVIGGGKDRALTTVASGFVVVLIAASIVACGGTTSSESVSNGSALTQDSPAADGPQEPINPTVPADPLWSLDAGEAISGIVAGDIVLVQEVGMVRAIEARTGAERWTASGEGLGLSGQRSQQVQSWPTSDGEDIAAAGIVVIRPSDEVLEARDLATGASRWRFTAPAGMIAVSFGFLRDSVFYGSTTPTDGSSYDVFALEAATGKEKWKVDSSQTLECVTDDYVLVGGQQKAGVVLDSETGNEIAIVANVAMDSPACIGATAYFETGALDLSTGQMRWRASLATPSAAPTNKGPVTIEGKEIGVAATSSGAALWSIPAGDLYYLFGFADVVVGGGTTDIEPKGKTTAWDAATGTQLWTNDQGLESGGFTRSLVFTGQGDDGESVVVARDVKTGDPKVTLRVPFPDAERVYSANDEFVLVGTDHDQRRFAVFAMS